MPDRSLLFRRAESLWRDVLLNLEPDEFRSRFDEIHQGSRDIPTLWQLGGAANDFLRQQPGSITVPEELPTMLLTSNHMDARVIGLKLINRCSKAPSLVVPWIILALGAQADYEVYGGLHELHELLCRKLPLTASERIDLCNALERLLDSADPCIVESANRYCDWLTSIEEV